MLSPIRYRRSCCARQKQRSIIYAGRGIRKGVHLVGDVMCDAMQYSIETAERTSKILERLEVRPKEYLLATVHRAENTDRPENLEKIVSAFDILAKSGEIVVFPAHPRTKKQLETLRRVDGRCNPLVIDPVSYLDMLVLGKHAKVVLTDSGGLQKEAYWFGVPCVTLRDETEWVETVEGGWNTLAGTDPERIVAAAMSPALPVDPRSHYGDGHAAERVVRILAGSHENLVSADVTAR